MSIFSNLSGRGIGLMGAVGLGMNVYMGLSTYDDQRRQGKNVISAGVRGIGEFVAWNIAPMAMTGLMGMEVAPALFEAGYVIGRQNMDNVRGAYSRNFGGKYVDTQIASNMRQAGIGNINQSKSIVGQAIGSKGKSFYTHNIRQSREFSPQADSKRQYTSQLGAEAKNFYVNR